MKSQVSRALEFAYNDTLLGSKTEMSHNIRPIKSTFVESFAVTLRVSIHMTPIFSTWPPFSTCYSIFIPVSSADSVECFWSRTVRCGINHFPVFPKLITSKEGIFFEVSESLYGMLPPEPFGTTAFSTFRFDVEDWLHNRRRKHHDTKRAEVRLQNRWVGPDCWYTGFGAGWPDCYEQIRAFHRKVRSTWVIGQLPEGSRLCIQEPYEWSTFPPVAYGDCALLQ